MTDVFCVHEELHFTIYGNGHFARYDVVTGLNVVGGVQTKIIGVPFVNFVGMEGTELSVYPGIAKIKGELARLRLNLHCVGLRRSKVHLRPRFLSKNAESQNLRTDENERRGNHELGAAGKLADLGARLAIREFENKEGKEQLSSEERKTGFSHGVRQR